MTGMECLTAIFEDYLKLPGRVVMYAQNWEMPNDGGIYIIIKNISSKTIGKESVIMGDGTTKDTGIMVSRVAAEMIGRPMQDMSIDPRGRRFEMELAVAPNSQIAQRYTMDYGISIQVVGLTDDLTAIEGAGNMCRFRQELEIRETVEKISEGNYFAKVGEANMEIQQ